MGEEFTPLVFTSESCLTCASDLLSAATKINEYLLAFSLAKDSIAENYQSESATEILELFKKIFEVGPKFHDAVEACSKYLSETVAPTYAEIERRAAGGE
ncbi:MAG: hypothetical protein IKQ35_06005 [Bacilli bacterium]|nr:hypothetical protein [Bacilli bacterium]